MATAPEVNPLTFIAAGDEVVVLGRIVGKTRKTAAPIDVTFAHVWTVREGYLRRLRAFTDTAKLVEALSEGQTIFKKEGWIIGQQQTALPVRGDRRA